MATMMRSEEVLEITALGAAAINSRSVDAHERAVLCLIDGRRTLDEIRLTKRIMKLPADLLSSLVERGLVRPRPASHDGQKQLPSLMRIEPLRKPNLSAPFLQLQRLCLRASMELGLRRFVFDLRINRANSIAKLLALLPEIAQALEVRHGYRVSRRFVDKAHGIAE